MTKSQINKVKLNTDYTFTPYTFTATAGQTVFSISPSTVNGIGGVLVEVNGISLPPADVSVVGSNVTIPACDLNDEVVIRVVTRFLAGSSATVAENVGFVQSGAGAVARTVDDKLKEWVSVKDYGAKGDGVTNDAAAIQTALNAAAGRFVKMVGSFNMGTTPITIPAGTTVDATGATLTWTGHLIGVSFTGSSSLRSRWFGGKLVGPTSGTYVLNSVGMRAQGTDNSPSAPTYVLGPEVENVEIVGWGEYGFFGAYLNGGHFINSEGVRNIGYGGVCGVSCNDFRISGNVIDTVTPGTSGDAYGVFVDRKDNPSEVAQPRSFRIVISDNIIKNVTSPGNNGQGIDTHGGVQFTVTGNQILDCQAGIFITASSISGSQQLAPKHCTVVGNTVRSSLRVSYGILVGGAVNAGVVAEYAEACTVANNTIEGHGLSGSGTVGALRLAASYGTVVSGNNIIRSSGNGIILDADNIGFSITGGSITDPYDNTYASPNCILVAGNNNQGHIGNVSFNFRNASLGTFVAVGSIRVNGSLTGLDLEFSRCPHFGLSAARLQYLPITTTGVNSTGLTEQSGSASLTAGSVTVNFPKRFPATPTVLVTNTSDLNPVRAATVTTTSVTFGGTGTTSFTWRASV